MSTIADNVIATLRANGVTRAYGVPGDSLNGFTEAMRRDGSIAWRLVRHEECAAFAAAADAELTGDLAVVLGSCGPGNLHLINGLFDAQRSRVPVKVDAVMETVGRATWQHSIRSLRPGGRIVIAGTTSGPQVDDAMLTHIFFLQLGVIGSTMGTRDELDALVQMLHATGTRPLVHAQLPLEQARDGFAQMIEGDQIGKIVFTL